MRRSHARAGARSIRRSTRASSRGRERFYHLDPRPLSEVEAWLEAFDRYWKERLVSLEKLLDEEGSQ
jgi:hypothetical protein